MKKFDYMEFQDDYGVVFDKEKYTEKEALEIAMKVLETSKENLEIEDIYVRYTINGGWGFENLSMYITCEKEERGAFSCLRVYDKNLIECWVKTYEEAVKEEL